MTNILPTQSDLPHYLDTIERDLLAHIIQALKEKKIPVDEAKSLAKDFLSQLPVQDREDLLEKLRKISKMHPQALETYIKFANEHETEERTRKLNLTAHHLSQGDIDTALHVVKGGIV